METKPLLRVLAGERLDPPPVWLMRQAGRYLGEYREVRARAGSFLDLCYTPDLAAEVTLQPIRRFGFDAAILFSDILVVPHALGQTLWFAEGEGPRLAPRMAETALEALTPAPERLEPVLETVRQVKAALPPEVTFIGFAGAPWTVATYMVEGRGSRDQATARSMAYQEPERFGQLIDAIVDQTISYLLGQIAAGVEVVQIFDSWSGTLSPEQFRAWVIAPTRRIVDAIREKHPGFPVIGFPKGAGAKLVEYARETGVSAVGLDETVDPAWANAALPKGLPVQGNLDPLALRAGGAALDRAVDAIREALDGRPHIFNLGHGILPDVPVAHVEQLLSRLRG
ncbi:uroporphyrinogen decarboxylase [Pedomonas sp. V897]|uniref:uroporphyrinogen decarboxylase n=1 Tax=Pedomonas sp. V897 TaxID=3446482 RepID=UPI003EE315E0